MPTRKLVVTLTPFSVFERTVRDAPEVLECQAMSGEQDYVLRIMVPDIEAYQRFLMRTLLHLPFVGAVNSSFVLKEVKHTTALPIMSAPLD